MLKTDEKLNKFSYMVMKEANDKKKEIIDKAEKIHSETLAEKEITYLKKAYEHIQESLEKIEKDLNQEVTDAVIINKQALISRREELIKSIFSNVKNKLLSYKEKTDYKEYLEALVVEGLSINGQDEVHVFADSDDLPLINEIRVKINVHFTLSESENELLGGCLIQNKTKGLMYDYSFRGSLEEEKSSFLEKYDLSVY